MIRHISALAAAIVLSLSSVACVAESEGEVGEEISQDLVSGSAFFETFEGLDGRHYFNLTASNGESVLRSEGYSTASNAEAAIFAVLENATDARKFDVREAANGEWYFNVKSGNGQIIGTSQFYSTKSNADRATRTVRSLVRLARQEKKLSPAPRRESFELFSGEDGQTYFHLRAGNGEILLSSEGYAAKAAAKNGIESVKSNGKNRDAFEVFEAADGRFGVRLVAANGEVIARGESYATKSSAVRAVKHTAQALAGTIRVIE